jgi:sugar-phosphatase
VGLVTLADRTFAAVIFDNDGTLVDSQASVVRSWVRWAQEHDIDPYSLQGFHGVPAAGIIAEVAPHLDAEAALARIDEIEVGDVEGVVAIAGAEAALASLPDSMKAVATSATRPLAEVRLAAAGLTPPPVTITIEDVERGKPAPDPFVLAAQRLGVDAADCLVVEDAPSGITGARAAGCAVLAVTTTSPAEDLADADLVVGSLGDVVLVVEGGRIRVTDASPVGG